MVVFDITPLLPKPHRGSSGGGGSPDLRPVTNHVAWPSTVELRSASLNGYGVLGATGQQLGLSRFSSSSSTWGA